MLGPPLTFLSMGEEGWVQQRWAHRPPAVATCRPAGELDSAPRPRPFRLSQHHRPPHTCPLEVFGGTSCLSGTMLGLLQVPHWPLVAP